MHVIDWCIMLIPMISVIILAIYSKKYVRGVVDYLAAGRVAGRYVISVGDMSSGLSVITLVAMVEAKYQTGYALSFWENITAPIGIVMALTGYCSYRFRETRVLSFGQFLEIRYNRAFRIFASTLRTISEMLTNAIGPAVAANFFIYFLDLPHKVMILGINLPTFTLVVGIVLILAMIVIWPAGRISLLVTDCLQGLMSYPIFVIIVGYIMLNYGWNTEISPVMLDRVGGESFLDPFDVAHLRDFNIFALVVTITGSIINRASWVGNDTSNSGRTPHEQKMAGILGSWRNGFSWIMCTLVAIMLITIMSHKNFSTQARDIRMSLTHKVGAEVLDDAKATQDLTQAMSKIPELKHEIGVNQPLSQEANLDTPYLDVAHEQFGKDADGNLSFQKFKTLYFQMMMPVALREILPVGLTGIFGLLMVLLLISTDDSRIFNASSTIVQDVILPFRKTPLPPQKHLLYLKIASLGVAVFFFISALFFVQLDYINMFITIMTAVWLGGAGPVMIFGLYSRFGTTAGAFASIIVGSGISIGGLAVQRNWADYIYPWLSNMNWVDNVDSVLQTVSGPMSPYIVWQMDPVKFPINSYELYFISMLSGIVAYILVSWITCKEPYNLDRMLHRGIYSIEGEEKPKELWTINNIFQKLIGITPEYTKGDKIIAWSVFYYSFVYKLCICFVGVLVWNFFSPWSAKWWSVYFYITSIIVSALIGIISTVWFLWGGAIDMRQLFRDLAKRVDNPLDDGRVEGNVSLVDKVALEKK